MPVSQVRSSLCGFNDRLKGFHVHTVGLTPTDWNVVNRVSAQDLQGLNEQRCGINVVRPRRNHPTRKSVPPCGWHRGSGRRRVPHPGRAWAGCFERVEENPLVRGQGHQLHDGRGSGLLAGCSPRDLNSSGTCTIGGSIQRVIEIEPQIGSKRAVK